MDRVFWKVGGGVVACLLAAIPAGSRAEDVYFHKKVCELTVTEGQLPAYPMNPQAMLPDETAEHYHARSAAQPYLVIEGGGEVYLDRERREAGGAVMPGVPNPNGQNLDWPNGLWTVEGGDLVAFRVPDRREVKGRLFVAAHSGSGKVVEVAFKVEPPKEQKDAKAVFFSTKGRHYERLLSRGLPGAPWFRHQMIEARSHLPAGSATDPVANTPPAWTTDLDGTFRFFSGGRAIDENLQLDREQTESRAEPAPAPGTPAEPAKAEERVKIETLKGISVAEMDFAAKLKGRMPALDPLAACIPADQHALFVPGLKAVAALLAETQGESLSVLNLVPSTRSEDRGVLRRYERQLGVSFADLGQFPGADQIKNLAVTGSDPDFPGGTDVAVLFETEAPDKLLAFLKERLDQARHVAPVAGGEVDGIKYQGARTPDRVLSAYHAAIGPVVVITNSRAQFLRLIDVAHGKTPRLADAPEYRFFRDRYPRGEPDESAFLVLTDATIRRWCGPLWRIASSRRLRAALALAEVQAENLKAVVTKETKDQTPKAPPGAIDLGKLVLGRSGVRSETYGTLDFMTPVVELKLDEVENSEAVAYGRWRDTYQENWRGVFDPIAVRLAIDPGKRLAADVSVMPLIAGTNYKTYLDVIGKARLAPGAGDPHPGTLAHVVMAVDVRSRWIEEEGGQLARLANVSKQVALGWLGESAAVYLDDDPFWAELAAAEGQLEFVMKNHNRLPVGIYVEVTSAARLALFLSGLHAFVDQSAPNLTKWLTREHRGESYVRVGEHQSTRTDRPDFALYYYASPRSLTLSLNESLIHRAIERQLAKADAPTPWLGQSLAGRVSPRGFETLGRAVQDDFRSDLQVRSWSNLPILNEWKRLFPDRDPLAVHEAAWGTTLVDPGGGRYVWNARFETMESTAFGHPGAPRDGPDVKNPLGRLGSAGVGLSFEDGGLRARTEIELRANP